MSKLYLPTKALFFQVFQHFRRKLCCRHHYWNIYSKCKTFVGKCSKKRPSYTFLKKPCSFKSFSILQENCGSDIISGTFKCKTFVGKFCKKRPLSKSYLPTKAKSFQSFLNSASLWRNLFVCTINDFGEINIWRSWWRRNVMRKKIHLLIK